MCVWSFCVCETALYFFTLQWPAVFVCVFRPSIRRRPIPFDLVAVVFVCTPFFSTLFFIFSNRSVTCLRLESILMQSLFKSMKKTNRARARVCSLSIAQPTGRGMVVALLQSIEKEIEIFPLTTPPSQWKFNQKVSRLMQIIHSK